MAWGVDKIEFVGDAIFRLVGHGHRVRFDGNSFFPLQIHGVEELILFLAMRNGIGGLQQAVGQGGFAVIDVSDDREISGEFDGHGKTWNQRE